MKKFFAIILSAIFIFSYCIIALAQEAVVTEEPIAPEPAVQEPANSEEISYTSGTVVTMDKEKKEIVISEYDFDTEKENNVVYSIAPGIELEEGVTLDTIKPETYVEVDYVIDPSGKRIAKGIIVYEADEE